MDNSSAASVSNPSISHTSTLGLFLSITLDRTSVSGRTLGFLFQSHTLHMKPGKTMVIYNGKEMMYILVTNLACVNWISWDNILTKKPSIIWKVVMNELNIYIFIQNSIRKVIKLNFNTCLLNQLLRIFKNSCNNFSVHKPALYNCIKIDMIVILLIIVYVFLSVIYGVSRMEKTFSYLF